MSGSGSEPPGFLDAYRDDDETPRRGRSTWWSGIRLVLLAAPVLLVAAVVFDLYGPSPRIVVSPRTTLITAPLAPDGLPDYSRHLLDAYGPAPAPEENAAAVLVPVLWPMRMPAADAELVRRAVGIPAPDPRATSLSYDQLQPLEYAGAASRFPWRGEDYPKIRDILDAEREAIERILEATDRPRYWLPHPDLLRDEPSLPSGMPPHYERLVDVVRVLVLDAMRHAGEGRFDEAWRRTLALHRLARLVGAGDLQAGGWFVAFFPHGTAEAANACTLAIVGSESLPDATLAGIRRELAALSPLPEPRAVLAGQRLLNIERLTAFTRRHGRRISYEHMFGRGPQAYFWRTRLDWNVVLEMMNDVHDRAERAAGLESVPDRMAAVKAVAASLQAAPGGRFPPVGMRDLRAFVGLIGLGHARRSSVVGRMICNDLTRRVLPILPGHMATVECSGDLAILAAALEAARRADPERAYPRRLEDLAPELLPAVPADPFTGKPLVYERRGDGYLLYSLGPDMDDDGGTAMHRFYGGWIVGGEWQTKPVQIDSPSGDIVVRMPMPTLPFAAP